MLDERDLYIRQQRAIRRLHKRLTAWIQWVAAGLLATFAFLELQNAPLDKITQAFDQNSFTKFGLYLYFTAWVIGVTKDTDIQNIAYNRDPNEGKIGIYEITGIVSFTIALFILFYIHDRIVWFQMSVLAFLILNIFVYDSVTMRRARLMIRQSQSDFLKSGDNLSYLKLFNADEYLNGKWQKRRFIALLLIAFLQVISAILLSYFGISPISNQILIKSVPLSTIFSYIPSILFLIFVFISEIWINMYRFRTFAKFATIDEIRDHFSVTRRRNISLPIINCEKIFFG